MNLDKDITICGIIAEYNPFHKGHAYHIAETKKMTGASCVVVIMSGDFTQRGEPSMCNKYIRTEMALKQGADMVIELPAVYALSSASDFARGGVSILNSLGCIDYLCFGSESGNIESIINNARFLINEDEAISIRIKSNLKNGLSFPAAKQQAYQDITDDIFVMNGPNNILGVEYVKSLLTIGSNIKPITIKRDDNGFNELNINKDKLYASARSIRNSLYNNNKDYMKYIPENIISLVPEHLIRTDDFSELLYYKLLSEKDSGFNTYLDVNDELSNKIIKNLSSYNSFSGFIEILKSKNLTHARISRALFHILLNIKKEDAKEDPSYARVLGFKKDAGKLTGTLKKTSSIPLITKLADAKMSPMLEKDIYCASLYEHILGSNLNEIRHSPVIL